MLYTSGTPGTFLCAWFILCYTHVRGYAVLPAVDITSRNSCQRALTHMPQNLPGATSRDFTRNREYHKIFRRYAPEPYKWCEKAPNFRRYAPKTHHQLFPHRYSTRPRSSHERHVTKRFYCSSDLYSKTSQQLHSCRSPPGGCPRPRLTCLPARPGARRAPAFALTAFAAAGLALAWLACHGLPLAS